MVNNKLLKNLETNRNSIEELASYTRHINEHAWTFSYLYPEDFGPSKFPDNHSFPTTISTNRMIRQFKVNSSGDFIIFYSPVVETFASYFNPAKAVGVPLDRGVLTEYIVYADSDSGNIPLNGSELANASNWPHINKPAPKFQNFRMIRLIGASLEVFVNDIDKNHTGVIEAGMSFAVAGAGLYADRINPDKIQNFSRYSRFYSKNNNSLVCRYRAPNNNFMEFGPYEPYMQVPYYVIRGKGLSPSATIGIIMTNHVEGVFWPEMSHFAYIPRFTQAVGATQRIEVEKKAGETAMEVKSVVNLADKATQSGIQVGDIKVYLPKTRRALFNMSLFDDPTDDTLSRIDSYAETHPEEIRRQEVEVPIKFKYAPKREKGKVFVDYRPVIQKPDKYSDSEKTKEFPGHQQSPQIGENKQSNNIVINSEIDESSERREQEALKNEIHNKRVNKGTSTSPAFMDLFETMNNIAQLGAKLTQYGK